MNQLQQLIQQQELLNLSTFLQQSLQGINTQDNYQTFQTLEAKPESYLYFLALLISPHFNQNLRELSGINLKNMLKRNIQTLPQQTLTLIKRVLFQQYDMQKGRVLKTIGLIMGAIVEQIKFQKQTLSFLLNKSREGNIFAIEGLKRIVQDFRFDTENMNMIQSQQFAALSKQLIAILIPQCYTQNKKYAIQCFNVMIYPMPVSLISSLKQYVLILKNQIINNNSNDILYVVMEGFEAIVSTRKDLIDPQIIEIIANKVFNDVKIAKIQVNFWIQALDSESQQLLKPVLAKILPKFISGLILTNEDISNIMQTSSKCYSQNNEQEDTLDAEDNEQQQFAKGGDYTLRKRCALMISKLSFSFSQDLWDLSKLYISELISSNDWLKHQLAILFIGLLSQNCSEILKPYMGQILVMINNSMNNAGNHSLLKSTCLWTLSENTEALVEVAVSQEGALNNYITLILNCMKDENNNVRQASCNSLSKLTQQIKQNIFPWFDLIIETITPALFVYKGNALGLLLQLYCTLAENIRKQNYNKKILDQILVPLCHKWAAIPKQSDDNCQVVECLVAVCEMGRQYLGQYTLQMYNKAIELFNPQNKHVFCRVADLIESLVKRTSLEEQQQINKSGIVQKTLQLLAYDDHQIKQSCYSLLSQIIEHMGIPNPPQVIEYVFNSINKKKESEINNGLHCMLEVMIKYPSMKEYLSQLTMAAGERLLVQKLQTNYKINYSKVFGIVAYYHPEVVAPYLKNVFAIICKALKASKQHTLKYHLAVAGLIKLIKIKGQQIFEDFKYFVDLGVNMKNSPAENQNSFKEILIEYRKSVGEDGWNMFLGDSFFLPGAVNKIQTLIQS